MNVEEKARKEAETEERGDKRWEEEGKSESTDRGKRFNPEVIS
jgi:hypothetical protein